MTGESRNSERQSCLPLPVNPSVPRERNGQRKDRERKKEEVGSRRKGEGVPAAGHQDRRAFASSLESEADAGTTAAFSHEEQILLSLLFTCC